MTEPPTWRMPRESKEWVGPISVAITVDGVTVPVDQAAVRFAVLPRRTRPNPDGTDWLAPVVEPGGTYIGVQADPVAGYSELGIWAKVSDDPEIPVLEPDDVGYLVRT